MEARKRLTSRRALLPQDVQLIEAVGISPEEYYEFLEACEYVCEKRSEAYSHIPDVRNGPVTPILVQLAIGVALSVAAALLAPKPKAPEDKKPPQLQTGDKTGKSKFTPYNDFDSSPRAGCPWNDCPAGVRRRKPRRSGQHPAALVSYRYRPQSPTRQAAAARLSRQAGADA